MGEERLAWCALNPQYKQSGSLDPRVRLGTVTV